MTDHHYNNGIAVELYIPSVSRIFVWLWHRSRARLFPSVLPTDHNKTIVSHCKPCIFFHVIQQVSLMAALCHLYSASVSHETHCTNTRLHEHTPWPFRIYSPNRGKLCLLFSIQVVAYICIYIYCCIQQYFVLLYGNFIKMLTLNPGCPELLVKKAV